MTAFPVIQTHAARLVEAVQRKMDKGIDPSEQQYHLTETPDGKIDLTYRGDYLITVCPRRMTPETLYAVVLSVIKACVIHAAIDASIDHAYALSE